MSTQTTQESVTTLAMLPRVNLLPPEIAAAQRLRAVQAGLGAGVLAALVVVGGLFVVATGQQHGAQSDLDTAKAKGTSLQAEQSKYADVPKVYAQVEARQAQLSQAMGQEIRWSYFLNDLSLTVPAKVWLTDMTVTQDVDGTASAAAAVAPSGASGFPVPGIATIEVKGHAYTHNDVAAWLAALGRQKSVTQPYFTGSTKELIGTDDAVTFTSQATVTDDAFSKRWTQKAGS
jgi:Tfp pilus assembly protein PilN